MIHHLVKSSLGALEIAGSLSGVPYVGTIVIVLQDIVECCHQVKVQKVRTSSAIYLDWRSCTHLAEI